MTNSLPEIYGQTLTNVVDCLKISIPAILEQAPEYSEQWINYQINSCIWDVIICAIVVAASSFTVYKGIKFAKENEEAQVPCLAIGIPALILSTLLLIFNITDLVKMKSAPKVYLIDKFVSYIKR